MRIMIASNGPHTSSGYGSQCRQLAPRLKAMGHDVAILSFFGVEGGMLEWQGIPLYPRGPRNGYGQDVIAMHASHFRADIVITLVDAWVYDGAALRYDPQRGQHVRWCVPGHTLVTLADGRELPIQEIVANRMPVKVKAWDGEKMVAADILEYQCIPSGLSGELIEVQTEGGENLLVTAENQVLVTRAGKTDWIDASCILPGDVVYCNSSVSSSQEVCNGTSQGRSRESGATNVRALSAVAANGVGVCCRDTRRGGDHLNYPGEQAGSLESASGCICSEHKRETSVLARGQTWNDNQYAGQRDAFRATQVQDATGNLFCANHSGVQMLPGALRGRTIPDCQEDASGIGDGIYQESCGRAVQRTIHPEGTGYLAPGAGFESQEVISVRRCGKPYPVVYDLTTSAGNFVAGNILIHNCPWFPVDHDPIPPRVVEAVKHAWQPITYSEFGQRQAQAAGLDSWYIPHGIETSIFTPQDRAESRRAMGIPEDAFLVGMVARNHGIPNRKLMLQNVEAFAMLKANHPEAHLYLHTEVGERDDTDAENIAALCHEMGLAGHVHFGNQYLLTCMGNAGFDDAWMARAYSAMDVLATVSMGEGFGLPIVEAQSCGTPVIHGDWCAGSELVGAGWRVKKEHAMRYRTRQHSYQWMAGPEVIHGALESAYAALQMEGVRAQLADAARQKALQYDADMVAREYWQPALQRLSDRLETPQRAILHTVRPEEVLYV